MVVRGGVEPPTPRFSGPRDGANWAKYGELSEVAIAGSVDGWTDLDGLADRWVALRLSVSVVFHT